MTCCMFLKIIVQTVIFLREMLVSSDVNWIPSNRNCLESVFSNYQSDFVAFFSNTQLDWSWIYHNLTGNLTCAYVSSISQMLSQQRPTKNIIRKSRDIELFKTSKIIKIGSRSSENDAFVSIFFIIKKKLAGVGDELDL